MRIVAVLALSLGVSFPAFAKETCDIVLRYDHIKRTLDKIEDGKTVAVKSQKQLDLRTNKGVCFEVTGTSTAVWKWDVDAASFDTLNRAAFGILAAAAGPYAFDIAKQMQQVADDSANAPAALAKGRGGEEVQAAHEALAKDIERIGEITGKIDDLAFRAESARVQMVVDPAETETIARRFAGELATEMRCIDRASTAPDCRKELKVIADASTVFADAQKHSYELATVAKKYPEFFANEVEDLQELWGKIRGDFANVLAAARAADELIALVAGAKGTWRDPKVYRATWDSGLKLTLSAAPMNGMDSVTPAPPKPVVASLVRKNALHLTAGFALLYSPDSIFDDYEVAVDPDTGDQQIFVQGENDQRITEALIIGMTTDRLDWNDENGFAIWVPQIVISPTGLGAIGIGAGFTYRIMGLSAGAVWHRQDVLVGHKPGDIVAAGDPVRMRTSAYDWDKPRWYVSLSITAPLSGPSRFGGGESLSFEEDAAAASEATAKPRTSPE